MPEKKEEKVGLHSRVRSEVAALARAAVYYTPGLTLDALIERALTKELRAIERSRGEPFPRKALKLKAGRPVKL